jgi:hypothetical protein
MRKRSKYRKKPVILDTITWVRTNMTPISQYETYLTDLQLKNHAAATALIQGKATSLDMNMLVAMNNITEALWRMGFGTQYADRLVSGHSALLAAGGRFKRDGRVTLYAKEIEGINALMELHDAQMEVITVKDMENALEFIKREVSAGRSTRIIEESHK